MSARRGPRRNRRPATPAMRLRMGNDHACRGRLLLQTLGDDRRSPRSRRRPAAKWIAAEQGGSMSTAEDIARIAEQEGTLFDNFDERLPSRSGRRSATQGAGRRRPASAHRHQNRGQAAPHVALPGRRPVHPNWARWSINVAEGACFEDLPHGVGQQQRVERTFKWAQGLDRGMMCLSCGGLPAGKVKGAATIGGTAASGLLEPPGSCVRRCALRSSGKSHQTMPAPKILVRSKQKACNCRSMSRPLLALRAGIGVMICDLSHLVVAPCSSGWPRALLKRTIRRPPL